MSDSDALSAQVDEIVARHEIVGLAVGLVGADGTFRFRGHGQADVTTRRAVTEDTVFRIASITKTFTAIAVMQLVEQGLVELDEPANRYLREVRLVPADPSHRPATARHLLSHSAGLGELAHLSGLMAELAGWYRLEGPWSDLRKRVFMGAGAEVFTRGGRPSFRFLTVVPDLYRGYPLRPDDPADSDVYRLDLGDAGTTRVAFQRDGDGAVTAMVLEMMPLRLRRQPAWTNPRRWLRTLLMLAALGSAAVGVRSVRASGTGPREPGARARSPGPPSQ